MLGQKIDVASRRPSRSIAKVASPQAPPAEPPIQRSLGLPKRLTFIALAAIFFVLGMIGIVLPVLPTTPFLLLTSYFLLRSWPSMNERLLRSRWVGRVLRDWQHRGGVRRDVKLKAIVLVGVTVCVGLLMIDMAPLARGILGCGALTGLLVIRRLPEVAGD